MNGIDVFLVQYGLAAIFIYNSFRKEVWYGKGF